MNDPTSVQRQAQQNAEDLNFYLRDLKQWETQIKAKDKSLLENLSPEKLYEQSTPAVRDTKSRPKTADTAIKKSESGGPPSTLSERIPSYKAWDKFDVDTECQKIDEEDKKCRDDAEAKTAESDESGEEEEGEEEEEEEDEEAELQRCKQQAIMQKDKGNQYYRAGKHDEAIVCYTKGIQLDPMNPLLMANRALALLKKEQYSAAAEDCRLAIELDPTYVKAYLRRAVARKGLKLYSLAKEDLSVVLQMEPNNKEAKSEMAVIVGLLESRMEATRQIFERIGKIDPIEKPKEQQSTMPLREVSIQEVDDDEQLPGILANKVSGYNKDKLIERATVEEVTDLPSPLTTSDKDGTSPDSSEKKATELPAETKATSDATTLILLEPGHRSIETRSDKLLVSLPEVYFQPMVERGSTPLITELVPSVLELPATLHDIAPPSGNSTEGVSKLPEVPLPPKSSFQFLTDFRKVKDSPDLVYAYIKQIPCNRYPYIFGNCLESDTISQLIAIYLVYYMWNDDDLYEPLFYLSQTKRFSMLKLFFTAKDKQALQELFGYMKRIKTKSEEELDKLYKAYDCT